jgi:hypothetical protein
VNTGKAMALGKIVGQQGQEGVLIIEGIHALNPHYTGA